MSNQGATLSRSDKPLMLSYKYRLYPTSAQTTSLSDMLASFCALYNAALQQRIEAYRRRGLTISYGAQAGELKAVRAADAQLGSYSYSAEQQVLRRLDKAFSAFFRRVKARDTPGFPRFRAAKRYHAAEFRVGDGMTIRQSGRLGIRGVGGDIKVKWHRALPSAPRSAILTRQNGKWFVVFHVEVETTDQCSTKNSVGVDAGVLSLVALSNGELIARPNWTKQASKGLRLRQRALARSRRGSRRRERTRTVLAAYHAKIRNRRRDHLHKLAADLVSRFSAIAVEDLNIKGLARGTLAKEIHDAAWAQLITILDYKAARAGGRVIKVDPRRTSQTCPECGTIRPKTLSERMHRCDCGCTLDRDVAAAQIIHLRAFGHGTCLRTRSERVAA